MFCDLEKELDILINNLLKQNLLSFEKIKSKEFLNEINKSKYLLTLHDVEQFRPICLNNEMVDFYAFENNWLKGLDYLYYLKTIHTSTYNTLLESISFFRKNKADFLNLKYKLLYKKQEWKSVIGTTKTVLRNENRKPKYAITLAIIKETGSNNNIDNSIKDLTDREKEIVELLCLGNSKKQISNELNISEHTVHTHSKNVYKKLNIGKVSELINIVEKYSIH